MRVLTLIFAFVLPCVSSASRYQGKELAFEQFNATLELDNGVLIPGKVTFKEKRGATLVSHRGAATFLIVKPECLKGPELNLDDCWPRIKVDIDDKARPRTGTLRIYNQSKGAGSSD